MKFYRLKPEYVLRGWEGISWVLVKRPQNQTRFLTQAEFQALMLCDGETEFHEEQLDATVLDELRQCEAEGIVQYCEKAYPLEADQHYRYYHNRYVKRAFWSVTGKCNYRCRHCYMDAPDAALGELSTEEALDLIDQMAACGILQVDITGGEPFMRKDFWQLVDRIVSYKMTIGIVYTNGWLLNGDILDQFEQRGLKPEFSISFDGVGWHDWMRGIPGAEEAALRALKLCRERDYVVGVAMCIHKGNVHTLPKTVEVMRAIGVNEVGTSNVEATPLWCRNSEGNAMTQREYTNAMLDYIRWYYDAGKPIEHLDLGGVADLWQNEPGRVNVKCYDGTENCLNGYLCSSTRWSCYITPEGRLLPCMPMTSSPEQYKFPRVQDIGLQKGLSDSYYMQFVNGRIRELFAANKECNACEYRYKCGGGCRAAALRGPDHNLMGCDRDMCVFWKNGYEELIRKTIEEAEAKYERTHVAPVE